MVRATVGTLLHVGIGKLSVQDFENILNAKNRCLAGDSMPAHALFLVDIEYPDDIFE
jgi:tRNA pseudouridine38-40 synthase